MFRFVLFLCLFAQAARADDAALCDRAASVAAQETGVPENLLFAISRVETARAGTDAPWPWTINLNGQGQWFDTAEQAEQAISDLADGGESFDIGCFQINTRWHGDGFERATEMLDPLENARYAARYLLDLQSEFGDWPAAIAAYHSRDADRGAGYRDKVAAAYDGLIGQPPDAAVPAARRGVNRYPLLLAGDPASAGTLVPRLSGVAPLIGGP